MPNETPDLAEAKRSNSALQKELRRLHASHAEQLRKLRSKARKAMNELRHIHYALDQHASVAVTDVNGVITYANNRFCELSGYSRDELIGQTHRVVKSGVHPPDLFHDLWQTILEGAVWHGELCNRKKNGELYWVDASMVPYRDEEGRISKFVSIRIDITARKHDQERLLIEEKKSRQINDRLRQIADSMPAMIAYWDSSGICRFANKAHLPRYGLAPHELVGMSIQSVFGATFEFKRPYIEAALKGERQLFDHKAALTDGDIRWWHSDYVPHWQENEVIGFYALVVDITKQKNIEADLVQAQKLESIGQLSAGIAHEINTPTQFIGNNIGFIKDTLPELLSLIGRIRDLGATSRDEPLVYTDLIHAIHGMDIQYLLDEVPKAIDQSLEGIRRIQTIVGAMKEFAHPAAEKTPVDINHSVNSTIIVASNEWKYVAEVETDLDPALPLVALIPGSFNQVILNLIVNAAHAVAAANAGDRGPAGEEAKGRISITTRRIEQWAEIRVKDTGCGIPESIRSRIFDPFFTTKPVGKGTGQGLAIAHDVVVNKHGGQILVESQLGAGTTFILRIPLRNESPDDVAVA